MPSDHAAAIATMAVCGWMQSPEADLKSIAHDTALHLKN
jgi:hypothetical protein